MAGDVVEAERTAAAARRRQARSADAGPAQRSRSGAITRGSASADAAAAQSRARTAAGQARQRGLSVAGHRVLAMCPAALARVKGERGRSVRQAQHGMTNDWARSSQPTTAAVLALALLLLAGCVGGRRRRGASRRRVLGDGPRGRGGAAPGAGVRAAHPGVRVRVQQIPWSAAHEKLLTAYVGDAMPDVFQLGNTWIPEFVALGALEPLDDAHRRARAAVRPDDYFPGILDTNVHRRRALRRALVRRHARALLSHRSAARRPASPRRRPTWDELASTAMAARQGSAPAPTHYAILLPISEWQPPVILALQRGATLLRDGDRYGDFRSAGVPRAPSTFYLDLFRRGLAPRAGEAQVANLYQDFAAGYFAFYITGPWNLGEFSARLPAALDGRWATAPMPGPTPAHPASRSPAAPAWRCAAALATPRPPGSSIEYLSEPAQQIEFYRLTGDLPARRAAWDDAALADDRYAQAFWTQLQHVRSTPKIPEWERIASKISRVRRGRRSAAT